VYKDANWDWKSMDMDSSIAKARQEVDPVMRAGDNLNAFLKSGGKLMLQGGWAEWRHGNELAQYYTNVLNNAGLDKADQVRLFLVPGMGHCGGGNGPNQYNKLAAIDSWVSTGKAPNELIMSRVEQGKVTRTRPTCAWPAVATYKGTGSEDEASSYYCKK
jgi:feruloyl esterase